MQAIDINCDLGESFGVYRLGEDDLIMPYITSANIACGYHAGDPVVMHATVELACRHRVAVGAHPGFPDLMGFGRRAMSLSPGEVRACVLYQLGALEAMARAHATRLCHVKAHGALYNLAAVDLTLAKALAEAVARFDATLIFVALAGSCLVQAGSWAGLQVAQEVFADRGYRDDGSLVPRGEAGALLQSPIEAAGRVRALVTSGVLHTVGGAELPVQAHTLCVHGDTPGAAAFARNLHQELRALAVPVLPLRQVVMS
ncbi:MAG TPA: LamB/YcsF family protein [Clostridiales bacterium UBA8153]|nr:LamB/YcsF family protein [Clostridiales bacterium UBA8153]